MAEHCLVLWEALCNEERNKAYQRCIVMSGCARACPRTPFSFPVRICCVSLCLFGRVVCRALAPAS